MRYLAALQIVRRRIGILRFELGIIDAAQFNVIHDIVTI